MKPETKKRLKCLFFYFGHDFKFVTRTADWLQGGTYIYQCTRCETVMETRPYQGGIL